MRTILIVISISLSTVVVGQQADTARKNYAVGIAWSLPIGGAVYGQVLFLKKFNVGIMIAGSKRFTTTPGWYRTFTDSTGATVGEETASFKRAALFSISVMGTYYVLGKNQDSRAGLTLSSGFGLLSKKNSWKMTGYGTWSDGTPIGIYEGVATVSGVSFVISLGGEFRLWRGRVFMDLPFVFFAATKQYSTSYVGGQPHRFFVLPSTGGMESIGTNFFNFGYKVFF